MRFQRSLASLSPLNGRWKTMHVYVSDDDSTYVDQGLNVTGNFHGQAFQDKTVQLIQRFLSPKPVFLDLAANEAVYISNTLSLERDSGWTGVCVEPNPRYWWSLVHRKCAVIASVVSDTPEMVEFDFTLGAFGGIVGDRFDNKRSLVAERRATVPLRDVLKLAGAVDVIDYMSLDVEGAELVVMRSFPFETHSVSSLSVERPSEELHALLLSAGNLRFMRKHGTFGDRFYVNEKLPRFVDIAHAIEAEVVEECTLIIRPSAFTLDECVAQVSQLDSNNVALDPYIVAFYASSENSKGSGSQRNAVSGGERRAHVYRGRGSGAVLSTRRHARGAVIRHP